MAAFPAGREDARQPRRCPVQVVDRVGIVPEDPEVRRLGRHGGQPPDHVVRIHRARGVAVFGDAPDALDGRVAGGELLHGLHVRPVSLHRHRDHLDSQVLADGKMPVVARAGAQELHVALAAPGRRSRGHSKENRPGHRVVHQGEAGVAADDQLLGRHLHVVGEKRLGLGDPVEPAVVAAVRAVLRPVEPAAGAVQHAQGQVELCRAGFAAGHVQGDVARLIVHGNAAPVHSGRFCVPGGSWCRSLSWQFLPHPSRWLISRFPASSGFLYHRFRRASTSKATGSGPFDELVEVTRSMAL